MNTQAARRLLTRIGRALVVLPLALLMLVGVVTAAVVVPAARASAATPQALLLTDASSTWDPAIACSAADTSSGTCGTPAPSCSGESNEQCALEDQGWAVTDVDGTTWDNMTQAQFASYQLLVIGDPTCSTDPSTLSAAVANESTWEPIVDGSMIIIGTDPVFHYNFNPDAGAGTLIWHGLAYAGAQTGQTGLYLDLSCEYTSGVTDGSAAILDGIESGFTVSSAGCADSIYVIASAGPLIGVTNNDLSGWSCSVHEFMSSWPSDFVPYALDTATTSCNPIVPGPSGSGVDGCPYIMARGGGVSAGSVGLEGPSGEIATGTDATLSASVEAGGSPVSDETVTLTCSSGPCDPGSSVDVTTDSSGIATYSYTDTTGGTDVWTASADVAGATQTSSPVDVTFYNPITPTNTFTTVFDAGTKASWTGTEATGASAYDTATVLVSGATGARTRGTTVTAGTAKHKVVPHVTSGGISGQLIYDYWTNGTCSGDISRESATTVSNGVAGNSPTVGPLAAGSYSFRASYSGSSSYGASTGTCEEFTVGAGTPTVDENVYDAGSNSPWAGTEKTGSSAYDTSSIGTPGSTITATGTVTYYLYAGSSCTGDALQTSTATLSDGAVPNSATSAALGGGMYSYTAVYNGDSNYQSESSGCQAFTVAAAAPTWTNTVDDAGTKATWSGSETTGATAYDTSTLTGVSGFTPTGTVTYTLYTGGSCTGSVLQSSTKTISDGAVPPSTTSAALGGGTYSYIASYSGDSNNAAGSSSCVSFTVGKANPTVNNAVNDAGTNAAWSGTEVTGAKAYDTSTASGVTGFTPSGSVTYNLYSGGTCSGEAIQTSTEVISGGAVPNSATSAALAGGTYSYNADYLGDSNYNSRTSSCVSFTVSKATPSVSNAVDDAGTNGAWAGTEVTGAQAYDTSSVTGVTGFTPTGTVAYSLYGGGTCSGTAIATSTKTIAAGAVPNSATSAALAAGTYSFHAAYSGDSNYSGPTSSCVSFTVAKSTPSLSDSVFDATSNTGWAGNEVTGATAYDTSTLTGVAGFTPTGTVTYNLYAGNSCNTALGALQSSTLTVAGNGSVPNSATTPALAAGSYSYTASYSGDGNYQGASATCAAFTVGKAPVKAFSEVVDDASTSSAWNNTEVTGATAYDTSAITGVTGFLVGGTVTYNLYAGSACQGTPAQTSTETITVSALVPNSATTALLTAGTYAYQASYSGNANYQPATSACVTFTVAKAPRLVGTVVHDAGTSSPWANSEVTGASAYDTATVGALLAGPATVAHLSIGGSHAVVPHTSVGIVPTGTVSYAFFANGTCSGDPTSTQTVTMSAGTVPNSAATGALGAGSYSYKASYSGDSNYQPATGTCESFSVSKSATSTSNVVGDSNTEEPWTGNEVTGTPAFDTASVSPSPAQDPVGIEPTGSVTYSFYASGTCSGDPVLTDVEDLSDGVPFTSVDTDPLAAGTYGFQATYGSDINYNGSTSACESFTVQQETPSIESAVDDVATGNGWAGTEITGAAAFDRSAVDGVDGFAPTGSVTYALFANGTCSGEPVTTNSQTLVSGSVPDSADSAALGAGSYSYEATYSGDGNYLTASGSCDEFTVNKSPTATTSTVWDVPPGGGEKTGSAAYDASTVSGVAGFTDTGSVSYTFYRNATCSGDGSSDSVNLAVGNVPNSTTTPPLAAGSYSFQAAYGGDGNYLSSTSPCVTFSVGLANTTTANVVYNAGTSQPWTGTPVTGASAYDTATVTGVTGFAPTGSVTYSFFANGTCSGTPATTHVVTLASGLVPASTVTGALADGTYSYEAAYAGDSNYLASSSACAPITVAKAPTTTTEGVNDSATQAAWSGTENQGAAAYDTSSIAGVAGFTPTGTVTYTLYQSNNCTGTPVSTQSVTMSGGAVPNSASTGELASGPWSYTASYGGNSQYLASASGCAPFAANAIGYRLEGGDGGLFAFHATYRGSVGFPSPPGLGLHIFNFVGMAAVNDGYWMVERNGGIFAFGSAVYYGSLPSRGINVNNIVGIAATGDGKGYWEVSNSGTIYSFGDAVSHGSLSDKGVHITNVVAIDTPDSAGYWLLTSTGAIYTFGDAKFKGACSSAGSGCAGATNIVGMTHPDASGYWFVSKTGGVYTFGDAKYHGGCSTAGSGCAGVTNVVGIASPGSDQGGYWLAASTGGVYAFGDAKFFGNEVGTNLIRPIIAVTG